MKPLGRRKVQTSCEDSISLSTARCVLANENATPLASQTDSFTILLTPPLTASRTALISNRVWSGILPERRNIVSTPRSAGRSDSGLLKSIPAASIPRALAASSLPAE